MDTDNITCCVDVKASKHCTRKCKNIPRHFDEERKTWYCSLHVPVGGECPVCFDDMTRNNNIHLSCDHVFHRTCLRKWLTTNHAQNCPCCRKDVSESVLNKLRVPVHTHQPPQPNMTAVLQAHYTFTYEFEGDEDDTDEDYDSETESETYEINSPARGMLSELAHTLDGIFLGFPEAWRTSDPQQDTQPQPVWVMDSVRRAMDLFHGFWR